VAALKFSDEALRDYVYYFLSTRLVSDYVFEKANTLMQPNLSVTDLKNLQVPVPENCNYTAVSEKIRGISSQIYELQALYTQKLNDLKELKQSLLQQAFAGELTKEDAA
jgi:type I restriction enzyme S subunit